MGKRERWWKIKREGRTREREKRERENRSTKVKNWSERTDGKGERGQSSATVQHFAKLCWCCSIGLCNDLTSCHIRTFPSRVSQCRDRTRPLTFGCDGRPFSPRQSSSIESNPLRVKAMSDRRRTRAICCPLTASISIYSRRNAITLDAILFCVMCSIWEEKRRGGRGREDSGGGGGV